MVVDACFAAANVGAGCDLSTVLCLGSNLHRLMTLRTMHDWSIRSGVVIESSFVHFRAAAMYLSPFHRPAVSGARGAYCDSTENVGWFGFL